jgi:hypothetical protein
MAALQVERLVDGDPVDPAEELVARVVVRGPLRDLEEDGLADVVGSSCLRRIQNAAL